MKHSSLLVAAAGLLCVSAASPASAAIERNVERTFSVQPGGTLRLETQAGNIEVRSSTDLVVEITAKETIQVDSDAAADERLKQLTLTFDQHGNDVTAIAKNEEPDASYLFGSHPRVRVDFVVTAPASFAADLKTSGGSVTVKSLDGAVRARTSGGNISLGRVGGGVDASTSGGNVSLAEGRAAVELRTSGGNISLGHAEGPADLHTSGGNIRVDSAENTLKASTSGGNVRAGLSGPIKGDCSLETSGGRVTLTVDYGVGFTLDAATSGGSVDAEGLTIAIGKGAPGKGRLYGSVNGGGPTVRLRSSGGSIDVQER